MQTAKQFRDFAQTLLNAEPPSLLQLSDCSAFVKLQSFLMQRTTTVQSYKTLQSRVRLQNLRTQQHLFEIGTDKEQLEAKLQSLKLEIQQPTNNINEQDVEIATANFYQSCSQNIIEPMQQQFTAVLEHCSQIELPPLKMFALKDYEFNEALLNKQIDSQLLQENFQTVYKHLAGMQMQNKKLAAMVENENIIFQQKPEIFAEAHNNGLRLANGYLAQKIAEVETNGYNRKFDQLKNQITERQQQFNQTQIVIKSADLSYQESNNKLSFDIEQMKSGQVFGQLRLALLELQKDAVQVMDTIKLSFKYPIKMDFKGLYSLNSAVNDQTYQKPKQIYGIHDVLSYVTLADHFISGQNLYSIIGNQGLIGYEKLTSQYYTILKQLHDKFFDDSQLLNNVLSRKLIIDEITNSKQSPSILAIPAISDKQVYVAKLQQELKELKTVDKQAIFLELQQTVQAHQ